MEWKTHIAGGAVAGAITLTATTLQTMNVPASEWYLHPLVLGFSILGGLTPDIDLRTSKAGQVTGAVSIIIQSLWGHRTLFHAPDLYLGLYYCGVPYLGGFGILLFAFMAGAISHIFLDMLNAKGVPLFYPFPGHYHIASIKTGGKAEKLITYILYGLFSVIMVRFLFLHFR